MSEKLLTAKAAAAAAGVRYDLLRMAIAGALIKPHAKSGSVYLFHPDQTQAIQKAVEAVEEARA